MWQNDLWYCINWKYKENVVEGDKELTNVRWNQNQSLIRDYIPHQLLWSHVGVFQPVLMSFCQGHMIRMINKKWWWAQCAKVKLNDVKLAQSDELGDVYYQLYFIAHLHLFNQRAKKLEINVKYWVTFSFPCLRYLSKAEGNIWCEYMAHRAFGKIIQTLERMWMWMLLIKVYKSNDCLKHIYLLKCVVHSFASFTTQA